VFAVPALGAFFVLAAILAGCGSGVPGDSVATVGGMNVTKTDFNHWMGVAAKGNAQSSPGQPVVVPDPPDFTRCVAAYRKVTPTPAKGKPKVTDAQLKTQCQQQYNQLRQQTMNFLIQADWVQGEAKDRGITVSDADVQKQYKKTKKQAFQKEKDFQNFLKQSGMTVEDILFRVRLDALSNKLRQKAVGGKSRVTQAQIAAYYKAHQSQFATPERRDLRIVLTKTKANAEQAKKALQSGQSWKSVAKQYSVDQQTKSKGGLLTGVVRGQQDAALDKASFSAPKGQLQGPVKSQFGYYVFEVQRISKATKEPLSQAQVSIRQQLIAQGQQKALNSFVADFRKKWTKQTDCRKGFVVQGCKNAPKTATATTSTSPTTPSG
jgi:foldase protein PrsA